MTANGVLYDFLGYQHDGPWTKLFEELNTVVTINFCSNNASSCNESASIVRTDGANVCTGTLAFWEFEEDAEIMLIDEANANLGLEVRFTNGKVDSCPENETVTTTLFLQCAPNRQDPDTPTFDYVEIAPDPDVRLCDFQIFFRAPEACFTHFPDDPTDNGATGLSGGWVFTIIVIVFTFVYFVGGLLYNRFLTGAKGSESVPNISFWRSLPGLVTDGCSYTKSLIFGGSVYGSTANDSYREVGPPPVTYGSQDTSGAAASVGPQYSQESSSNPNGNNAR